MSKESFINNLSDETVIKMIDKTYKYEKNKNDKGIKSILFKMIPAAAAIALVIGLANLLPVININKCENINNNGIIPGAEIIRENTTAPAIAIEEIPELPEIIYDAYLNQYVITECDENGNRVKETHYDDAECSILLCEVEYDENGNLTVQTLYNADGSIEEWYEYEYDKNGKTIKETVYNADDSIKYWIENEYDEYGIWIKANSYDANGTNFVDYSLKEYDENGNLVKETIYGLDFGLGSNFVDVYDKNGNRIRQIFYDDKDNVLYWVEHECDEENRDSKMSFYDADGSIMNWHEFEYEYDVNGMLHLKRTMYNADGSIEEWVEIEYGKTPKNKDIWIKTTVYDADGNITEIIN